MATIQSIEKRIRKRAGKRLLFDEQTTEASKLDAYKNFLKTETEAIKKLHREGASGLQVANALTVIVDILLETLAEPAFEA